MSEYENDGMKLLQELCKVESDEQVMTVLGSLEGPYAFVFYHAGSQSLYFGRDPLGRRSLLVHWPTLRRPYFVLSSVSDGADSQVFSFEELETGFLFRLWLSDMRSDTVSKFLIDCSC